jgi:hypothetical protein
MKKTMNPGRISSPAENSNCVFSQFQAGTGFILHCTASSVLQGLHVVTTPNSFSYAVYLFFQVFDKPKPINTVNTEAA